MLQTQLRLPEVDEAKITLVMDNSVDILMAGSEVVQRFLSAQICLNAGNPWRNTVSRP